MLTSAATHFSVPQGQHGAASKGTGALCPPRHNQAQHRAIGGLQGRGCMRDGTWAQHLPASFPGALGFQSHLVVTATSTEVKDEHPKPPICTITLPWESFLTSAPLLELLFLMK